MKAQVLRKETVIVPRPVVTVVVVGVLIIVGGDILGQLVIPGHTANPLLDGPLIALLASILAGSKGPKPSMGPEPDEPPQTVPQPRQPGRHRGESS